MADLQSKMDSDLANRMASTVTFVVEKIASGHFVDLVKAVGQPRVSGDELKSAIEEYGIEVASDPVEFDQLNVVEIELDGSRSWSVWCDLVDSEKGLSDIQLRLTLIDNQLPIMSFEVDGIRVP